MPLSLDNIVNTKSGSFDGTSGTVTLDAATTAGNAIIICTVAGGDAFTGTIHRPDISGFTRRNNTLVSAARCRPDIFVKLNSAGGENNFAITWVTGGPEQLVWYAFELTGVGLDPNADYSVRTAEGSVVTSVESTRSTGTTDASSSYDTLSLALFAGAEASASIPAFSGYTNGFEELFELGRDNGSRSVDLAVAAKFKLDIGTEECTAAVSPDAYTRATMVTFFADGAKRAPDIVTLTGFEFGTASGIATGSIDGVNNEWYGPLDEAVGSPAVVAADRTGENGFCLELSAVAAAESVAWLDSKSLGEHSAGVNLDRVYVDRIHLRFPTALPLVDTEIAWIEAGSVANGVVVWYRSASQKIGVVVGSGTEVLSDATVAADKWIGIDRRYDTRATTHLFDWRVDYDTSDATGPVAQTQATGSSLTAATISRAAVGWPNARTATVRYDDWAVSRVWGAYPIGDIRVKALKVDPAGTPTVSGTSTNFERFTSNGTGSAFNAAQVRDAVDELPPTLGGSSDGIMQVAVATGDYVEFPMDTFTASPAYVLRAVRGLLCGWAASGNPGSLAASLVDGDGTAVPGPTFAAAVDHGFDNSAAVWLCRIFRTDGVFAFYDLTQARLNGMKVRVGWSADANPDVGIHAIYLEVAYQPVDVFRVSEIESGAFTLDVRQDPVSGAVAGFLISSNHATRGCTATATVNSVDYTNHANALETNKSWDIGASSIEEVTAYGLTPDA